MIPRNVRVAEAPSHGKPILLYDYDCAGSQAYIRLATEIIERERRSRRREPHERTKAGQRTRRLRLAVSADCTRKEPAGPGLASLIGEPAQAQPRAAAEGEQRLVAIDLIRGRGLNPRKDFRDDELDELAEFDPQQGPRAADHGAAGSPSAAGYEIVAGERRWRAAQRAGLHHVPVIVRELADQEVLELAHHRERAARGPQRDRRGDGYRELIERFGYTPGAAVARSSARAAAISPTPCAC